MNGVFFFFKRLLKVIDKKHWYSKCSLDLTTGFHVVMFLVSVCFSSVTRAKQAVLEEKRYFLIILSYLF